MRVGAVTGYGSLNGRTDVRYDSPVNDSIHHKVMSQFGGGILKFWVYGMSTATVGSLLLTVKGAATVGVNGLAWIMPPGVAAVVSEVDEDLLFSFTFNGSYGVTNKHVIRGEIF